MALRAVREGQLRNLSRALRNRCAVGRIGLRDCNACPTISGGSGDNDGNEANGGANQPQRIARAAMF